MSKAHNPYGDGKACKKIVDFLKLKIENGQLIMNDNILVNKSFKFAVRIINLYKYLCDNKKEFILSKQLLRSGTSIGANINESQDAQSKNDFISKLSISLKEARELNPDANYGDTLGVKMESDELGRIAAQVAKQVIIQKIKNLESDIIYNEFKNRVKEVITGTIRRYEKGGIIVDMTDPGKPNFCSTTSDQYDEFFHIGLGEKLIEKDPWMVYCGVFEDGDKIRAIIYSGDQAANDKKAGDIAKIVSEILGGAGGGNQRFAQGGGKDKSKKNDAIEKVKSMVLEV